MRYFNGQSTYSAKQSSTKCIVLLFCIPISPYFWLQLHLKNMNLVSLVQSICVNISCDIEVILYDLLFVFASTKGFHPAEDLFNS